MAEEKVKEEATKPPSATGIPKPLVIIIIVLVVLFILGTALSLVGGFFAKRLAKGVIEGAIQSKTGVKTNLSDVEKGKLTFTDTKTGSTVEVGTGKIPDNFPKDFPIYPGSKVTSSLSGNDKGQKGGIWLTLATNDSLDKVTSFYKTNLKSQGWTISSTLETGTNLTLGVNKGTWQGTVTIDRPGDAKETTILIVLGQGESTPSTTPTPTQSVQAPTDTSTSTGY